MSGRRGATGFDVAVEDGDEEETGRPRNYGTVDRRAAQHGSLTPGNPGSETPGKQGSDKSGNGCPQEDPQSQGVYTVLTPNAEKFQRLKIRAAEEEAALDQLRREKRAMPVRINPSHVGGFMSEEEVRRNQQLKTSGSRAKIQAQIIREERERSRRAEEDAELQKKKDIQRQKAELAEILQQQRDVQRKRTFAMDHYRTNEHFLEKVEWSGQKDTAQPQADTAPARSKSRDYREYQRKEEEEANRVKKETQRRKAEDLEKKKKAEENERAKQLQMDHRRANQAFLDRLEGRNSADMADTSQSGSTWHEESSTPSFQDDDRIGVWRSSGANSRTLDSYSSSSSENTIVYGVNQFNDNSSNTASSDIAQLQDKFPWYNEQALKQILDECSGDLSRVCSLLSD